MRHGFSYNLKTHIIFHFDLLENDVNLHVLVTLIACVCTCVRVCVCECVRALITCKAILVPDVPNGMLSSYFPWRRDSDYSSNNCTPDLHSYLLSFENF